MYKLPIIIFSEGGLGNQLFQAAFALSLEKKFNRKIIFISLSNSARTARNCELIDFGFNVLLPPKLLSTAILIILRIIRKLKIDYFFNSLLFDRGFFKQLPNKCPIIVYGYWQKEIFYKDGIHGLKSRLNFLLDNIDSNIVNFKGNPSKFMAVHIRRGDYVEDKKASDIYNICSLDYFYRATSVALANNSEIDGIMVFSDDPNWVKSNINFKFNTVYVEPIEMPSWMDLAKMSRCGYFVISNSSYSFWAATLSEAGNLKKYAPNYWTKGVETSTIGLLGQDWVGIEVI